MLRISWTEHVTNEEVFHRANTKTTLLDGLLKRRLAFLGHLARKGGITLDLMIGRLHGTRPRGRPRTTWLKDLPTQANISYKEAITIPRDRKKWRSVGNPRKTPDEPRPMTRTEKVTVIGHDDPLLTAICWVLPVRKCSIPPMILK